MSPLIRGLTIALWLLPIALGLWALVSREQVAFLTFLFLLVLYGEIWIACRPSHFVVSRGNLEIVFPIWRRRIPMQGVQQIRIISQEMFRQEFGWAMRIGVGGLWGGFGWLWTSQRGLLEFYISRVDDLVLIERLTGNSLLITPENPRQFVEVFQENR
jgi:hypothetical protein